MIWLALILASLSSAALAHDWYPQECCSGHDCRPVACTDIKVEPFGARYLPEDVDFGQSRVRASRDEGCHVCIGKFRDSTGVSLTVGRCVFLPGIS